MAVRSAPDTERSETARRGTEIYERDIKPTLGEDQDGRYISVDVDSGCWAIADTHREAVDELYARYPDSHDVWSLRVGYQALFSLGGRPLREEDSAGGVRVDSVGSSSEATTAPVRTQADRGETGRRGEEIYERDIEPLLGDDQHGRVVAIDVDSGCWAIADDVLQASADLRVQKPGATDVWLLRVGYRALESFGGRRLRSPK